MLVKTNVFPELKIATQDHQHIVPRFIDRGTRYIVKHKGGLSKRRFLREDLRKLGQHRLGR